MRQHALKGHAVGWDFVASELGPNSKRATSRQHILRLPTPSVAPFDCCYYYYYHYYHNYDDYYYDNDYQYEYECESEHGNHHALHAPFHMLPIS